MRQELQYEVHSADDIPIAMSWAQEYIRQGLKRGAVLITLGRPRRTLDQNRKLWPMLHDISTQVPWPDFNTGEMVYLREEEWKELFTASLRRQKMIPGIDGGVVMVGASTSGMNKQTFSELIELIYAFGSERNVQWSESVHENDSG